MFFLLQLRQSPIRRKIASPVHRFHQFRFAFWEARIFREGFCHDHTVSTQTTQATVFTPRGPLNSAQSSYFGTKRMFIWVSGLRLSCRKCKIADSRLPPEAEFHRVWYPETRNWSPEALGYSGEERGVEQPAKKELRTTIPTL